MGVGFLRSGHRFLPLGDLHRVDVEILGDLLDGFHALDRFKRDAGLEFGACLLRLPSMLCVWYGLKSAPTHHNHSLTTGPIFGVWLKQYLNFDQRPHPPAAETPR